MKKSLKRNLLEIAFIAAVVVISFFGVRIVKTAIGKLSGSGGTTTEQLSEGGTTWLLAESTAAETEKFSDEVDTQTQQVFLYNFRRSEYLTEHFEKHGGEFGYKTEQEYLAGANEVIMAKDSLCKTEAEDGDYVFFQESTGSIVFVSTDGYIRTYFKPTDGIEYFNRQ